MPRRKAGLRRRDDHIEIQDKLSHAGENQDNRQDYRDQIGKIDANVGEQTNQIRQARQLHAYQNPGN